MRDVDCTRCGVRVLVEKRSWEHTSVQWGTCRPDAVCPEFRDDPALTVRGARVGRCSALGAAITAAVVAGLVPVVD